LGIKERKEERQPKTMEVRLAEMTPTLPLAHLEKSSRIEDLELDISIIQEITYE
jgi:hypothetical protein